MCRAAYALSRVCIEPAYVLSRLAAVYLRSAVRGTAYVWGPLYAGPLIASRLCAGATYVPYRLCIEPLIYCTEPLMCRAAYVVPDGLYTEALMCRAAYVVSRRLCTEPLMC